MPAPRTSSKQLGPVRHTARGFQRIEFHDRSRNLCILQQSSIADYTQPGISAVYIGAAGAHPMVMASEAASVGVATTETTGWVPYPIPLNVHLTTDAHLDRNQVKALIRHLQSWLDTGSFKPSRKNEG